jgi:hypothetical protein
MTKPMKLILLTAAIGTAGYFWWNAPRYVQPAAPSTATEAPAHAITFDGRTRALLQEYTSTGCPGCGSWGKPTFMELATKHADEAVALSLHIKYRDPMITAESEALGDNRTAPLFTPQIWVDGENAVLIRGGGIDPGSAANASRMIKQAGEGTRPSVAIHAKSGQDLMEVTYGARFTTAPRDGEYRLACYLVENGIVHKQAGHAANPATHDHVLRASADGALGSAIAAAQLDVQRTTTRTHTFALTSTQSATNTHAVVVLWMRQGDRWVPVNSHRS